MVSFNQICKDIKSLKIQGADNVAINGLKAYSLRSTKTSIKILTKLRPTEPALFNALKFAEKYGVKKALEYFKISRQKITKIGTKIIKKDSVIFTHCHSSTVMDLLKQAKKQGKKFQVMNTETRPLYQGRKTARELAKAKIKVTTIVDSAANKAIEKSDLLLFGADAILKNKVINKIGSGMFAELAHTDKTPVYIACNSWKYSKSPVKIEERNYHEVWKRAPKSIKIKNPAFGSIDFKYIKAIISELGVLTPKQFIKKVKKRR